MNDSSAVAHPRPGDDYLGRSDLVYFFDSSASIVRASPGKSNKSSPFKMEFFASALYRLV